MFLLILGHSLCIGVLPAAAATLRITITDAETGLGVEELRLTLFKNGSERAKIVRTIRGNAEGVYEFTELTVGEYALAQSNAPLFKPTGPLAGRYLSPNLGDITISSADETIDRALQVPLGAHINGRVLDDEGNPARSGSVMAYTSNPTGTFFPIDENGRFEVFGADSDSECRILVRLKQFRFTTVHVVDTGDLAPGETFDLGDIIVPMRTGEPTLRGTIKYPDGTSKSGRGGLHMESVDGKYKAILFSNDGEFSMEMPPGRYLVRNYATGRNITRDKDLVVFEQEIEIKESELCEVDFVIPKQTKRDERRAREREAKKAKVNPPPPKDAPKSRLKKRRRPKPSPSPAPESTDQP